MLPVHYARWATLALSFGLLATASPVRAQDPSDAESDSDELPLDYGLRFTPGMANGLARLWTSEILMKHYEMDKAKELEATEVIARRLMKLAHTDEAAGQELFEYTFTQMFETMSKRRQGGGGGGGIPPDLAQGVAQRLLPFMPAIRETVDGITQDVRPMLPFKGQLKMTGELAMAKMGLDAFEENMKKWSKGEVDPFGDPFRNQAQESKKDAEGQTEALKNARRTADMLAARIPGSEWDNYVEEAKKYFELDSAQAATADSLLRDFKQRAIVSVGNMDEWHAQIQRNRLWWGMSTQMPGRWNSPLRTLLDMDYAKIQEPVNALGEELKQRIEEIPTQAQRDAAERRIQSALAEKGLAFESEPPLTSAPAISQTQKAPDSQAAGKESDQ